MGSYVTTNLYVSAAKSLLIMDNDILENDDISMDEIVPLELSDDAELKDKLMGLYQHWMANYMNARDQILSVAANKLHAEFVSDQKKIREELITQFTEELETTKKNLEEDYMKALKMELAKRAKRHKEEIADAKKTQWCALCENESIYFCCWNTSYCSQRCQYKHWKSHRSNCRHPRIVAFKVNNNRELAQQDLPRFQTDDVATDTSEELVPEEDAKHDQPNFNQVPPIISESLSQPNDLCHNQQGLQCLDPSTTDAPTLIAADVFEEMNAAEVSTQDPPTVNHVPQSAFEHVSEPNDINGDQQGLQCYPSTADASSSVVTDIPEEKIPTEDMKVDQLGVGHVPPAVSDANDLSDNQHNLQCRNLGGCKGCNYTHWEFEIVEKTQRGEYMNFG